MIKENLKLLKYIHISADLTLTAVAFICGFLINFALAPDPGRVSALFYKNSYVLALIIPIWLIFLFKSPEAYTYRMKSVSFVMIKLVKPLIMSTAILAVLLMIAGNLMEIRSEFLLFAVLDFGLLYLFRSMVYNILSYFRARGKNQKNILIIGTGKKACEFFDLAKSNSHWGINVLGFVSENGDIPVNGQSSLVIGKTGELPRILNRNPVDEVYIALPISSYGKAETIISQCQEQGITSHLAAEFKSENLPVFRADDILGSPVLTFSADSREMLKLFVKRVTDILVSGVLLILFSPVFLMVAIAIKLGSRGPVFYKWKVVGHNRKEFTGYKFRSMVPAADRLKAKLISDNEMKGVVFKMKNDPRITRIGRFIRKYSIDELPQLYNVFKGDMSLVGPRPPLQSEIDAFANWHRRKLSVKPGITCLWQVSGRNRITDFDEWVKLDLQYIDNWSLWLDAKIMARTIPAVLMKKGAM
jgi:exopolysaccharide biosynthesis polyprenyl glycosylphosphotransferase